MTCIIGMIQEDGTMHMAGDRGIVIHEQFSVKSTIPKIVNTGGMLIGAAGDIDISTAINSIGRLPDPLGEPFEYISKGFVPRWKELLSGRGLVKPKTDEDPELFSGEVLVLYEGCIFYMASTFSVVPIDSSYHAIGSATPVALGAMSALHDKGSLQYGSPDIVMSIALDATVKHCLDIRAPYDYISSEPK